jgi:hypothetical protein
MLRAMLFAGAYPWVFECMDRQQVSLTVALHWSRRTGPATRLMSPLGQL